MANSDGKTRGPPQPLCNTYYIVAGYVKRNLRCSKTIPDDELERMFPPTSMDYEGDEFQVTLCQIIQTVKIRSSKNMEKLTAEKTEQILFLTDHSSKDAIIISVFNDTLRTWLLDDNHTMSWERVLMAFAFTMSMINQNLTLHKEKARSRVLLLVGLCADFIDNFLSVFIELQGGWAGLMGCCNRMLRQQEFDIPCTAKKTENIVRSIGGTVYVDGEAVIQKTLLTEKAEKFDCSYINFDIISAYVRDNLRSRNSIEHNIEKILPDIMKTLREEEVDYSKSDVVNALADVAKVLVHNVYQKYDAVTKSYAGEICHMKDLNTPKYAVWTEYNIMMFAWLVQDEATPSWDRIIMLLEFTSDLVYSVAKLKGVDILVSMRRVYDLVHIATEFINTYFHKWIYAQGGWEKVVSLKPYLQRTKCYNIPATAVFKPPGDDVDLYENPDQLYFDEDAAIKEFYMVQREHFLAHRKERDYVPDPPLDDDFEHTKQQEITDRYMKLMLRDKCFKSHHQLMEKQRVTPNPDNPDLWKHEYMPDYTGAEANLDDAFGTDSEISQIKKNFLKNALATPAHGIDPRFQTFTAPHKRDQKRLGAYRGPEDEDPEEDTNCEAAGFRLTDGSVPAGAGGGPCSGC